MTSEATSSESAHKERKPIAVQLDGVSKGFNDVMALHDAWLKIERGEFLTLLGPSGCGKSTLLNLVAGFLECDHGEIFIDGKLVTETPPHKREIGIVFQNYALFPHMSVAKNVGYGLRMRGIAKAEITNRVGKALALVKLGDLEDRKPSQLSGGQQQRVALARALVIEPKVLLLDEPFSALDKNLRASMQVELKDIQRQLGVTTIFVTHDQNEALSMSDRVAVMSQGRIRQVGSPDEIYRHPQDRYVASFVGDVNVIAAKLESRAGLKATISVGSTQLAVPSGNITQVAPGEAVDIFVRPEHLTVTGIAESKPISGSVTAHVYHGGHVDLYVESSAARSGQLLVRIPGYEAIARWPVGTSVGIDLPAHDMVAFPVEE